MLEKTAKQVLKDKHLRTPIDYDPLVLNEFLTLSLSLLSQSQNEKQILLKLKKMRKHLEKLLLYCGETHISSKAIVLKFFQNFKIFSDSILSDATAIFHGDPASESLDEIFLAYPGLLASTTYRLANFFYKLNVSILPRLISEYAHSKTGIDIHPGATIGKSFCIDHGTGVVIGETTKIGNNVTLYQGVTLGALSVKRGTKKLKIKEKNAQKEMRHPTIEDNCIIYANATILGGKTIIGKNSVIGGNVWLTKSVPENSTITLKGICS